MEQVAIVTGGASGIGLALSTALVQRGWHVVLADLQDVAAKEHAHRLTTVARARPSGCVSTSATPTPSPDWSGRAHAERGRLDLMVNYAGIGLDPVEPEELELVHWDRISDTNLRAVIHGCQAAYPLMLRQGHVHFRNVASVAGLIPSPGQMAPYATTKFGVVGLSRALRAAGADHGIRVTALPGFIDTPLLDGAWPEGLPIPPRSPRHPPLAKPSSRRACRSTRPIAWPRTPGGVWSGTRPSW